ncbi:MAG: hypothetical protein AB9866_17415 [Syntrophobacteraceae bacterium]
MSYEQVRELVLNLDKGDQKRLIEEVVPEVWAGACADESCAYKIKELVDNDIWRPFEMMHMGGI